MIQGYVAATWCSQNITCCSHIGDMFVASKVTLLLRQVLQLLVSSATSSLHPVTCSLFNLHRACCLQAAFLPDWNWKLKTLDLRQTMFDARTTPSEKWIYIVLGNVTILQRTFKTSKIWTVTVVVNTQFSHSILLIHCWFKKQLQRNRLLIKPFAFLSYNLDFEKKKPPGKKARIVHPGVTRLWWKKLPYFYSLNTENLEPF